MKFLKVDTLLLQFLPVCLKVTQVWEASKYVSAVCDMNIAGNRQRNVCWPLKPVLNVDFQDSNEAPPSTYNAQSTGPPSALLCSLCVELLLCVRRSCGGNFWVHTMASATAILLRNTTC
jgi:hypothetical protein